MEEIKVGEYIRTHKGDIHRVIGIREELRNGKRVYSHKAYFLDSKKGSLTEAFIIKHNQDIRKVIEVGDYVNGMEVLEIYTPRDLWEPIEIRVDSRYMNYLTSEDIKTILTKEQYKANCYEVK